MNQKTYKALAAIAFWAVCISAILFGGEKQQEKDLSDAEILQHEEQDVDDYFAPRCLKE